MDRVETSPETSAEVTRWLTEARAAMEEFDPELVIIFGPDHLNAFVYSVLPQFCVITSATSLGDYGGARGDFLVPGDLAERCLEAVLAAGVDVAMSARATLDHAFAQPMELLFGGLDARPVIPIFINAAAPPLAPISRARVLGEAVGAWAGTLGLRVLFVGSGGLSHDPPSPSLKGATPEVFDRLVNGMAEEARPAREKGAEDAAREFAAGRGPLQPLAPDFDRDFMALLADRRLHEVDGMSNEWLSRIGGKAVHEIRTWVAAFSALGAVSSDYEVTARCYRPIPEWIVGYGGMIAA